MNKLSIYETKLLTGMSFFITLKHIRGGTIMSFFYPTVLDTIKSLPLYLTSIGLFYDEVSVNRPIGYVDYQWLQTISGSGIIKLGNEEILLTPSVGLFIPANIPHSYHRIDESWITNWVSFNGQVLPNILDPLGLEHITPVTPIDNAQLVSLFEIMYAQATENYSIHSFSISSKLYTMLEHIHASTLKQLSPLTQKNDQLNKVLNYIDQNYMQDLTILDLSQIIHVSPQYLCRLFKAQLMMRPFEYINQVRINKSKTLLNLVPSIPIEDIAKQVGYHNPSYFTSLFKSLEKITPREFMQIHQRGVM